MADFIKLKRTEADQLFSKYIRERSDWFCEKCFMDCKDNKGYLDCSHYHSRAKRSVRFDPMNAAALCKKCHDYMGKNPREHEAFFLKRLGRNSFQLLELRASIPMKVDEKLISIWLKEEIQSLQSSKT